MDKWKEKIPLSAIINRNSGSSCNKCMRSCRRNTRREKKINEIICLYFIFIFPPFLIYGLLEK